jgi:hypothetical protein
MEELALTPDTGYGTRPERALDIGAPSNSTGQTERQ